MNKQLSKKWKESVLFLQEEWSVTSSASFDTCYLCRMLSKFGMRRVEIPSKFNEPTVILFSKQLPSETNIIQLVRDNSQYVEII